MTNAKSRLICAGCGHELPFDAPQPWRCPKAAPGDNIDHVVARELDVRDLAFRAPEETNPFLRYRRLQHSWHVARAHGMSDADYVALVRALDAEVARVDGGGFAATPCARHDKLSRMFAFESGGVWVKDETGSVGGSHKARHLMGLMIHLLVLEKLGLVPADKRPRLAIASCGNAALAAGVVARAAARDLDVFVPPHAEGAVVERLSQLGAHVVPCPRTPGVAGDPCYLRFREAIGAGALPFCCQGSDNGLTIEGGRTLAYELVEQLTSAGAMPDRVFIQVGGGALASAVIQGLRDAMALQLIPRMPRIHAVQTGGAYPLKRAWTRLTRRMLEALGLPASDTDDDAARAETLREHAHSAPVQLQYEYASRHRGVFMWPWEQEPRSIAEGILDDETYDWLAVVRGLVDTGGTPLVVEENTLAWANAVALEHTKMRPSATGSAGLAGLMHMRRLLGEVPPGENWVVLFTGVKR